MSVRNALLVLGSISFSAAAEEDRFSAALSGYQEVAPVSTAATGRLRIDVNSSNTALTYQLDYSGLQGPVMMARVYFGQRSVNGGLLFWLCGTPAMLPPAGTPACPQSGRVTGTIAASQIVGSPAQGIQGAELAKVLRALRAGLLYVNVRSAAFPGGELRGQLEPLNNGRDDDDDDGNQGRGRDR